MKILITGATGYIGSVLVPRLIERGHDITVLVREQSLARVPKGCNHIIGDALDATSFIDSCSGFDVLVHLVGVAHPNPTKSKQFVYVDLKSVQEVAKAVELHSIPRVVYVSVAHPAPVMKSYWKVRAQAEQIFKNTGSTCTFLRPWYVVGPGHNWAQLLAPAYSLMKVFPFSREIAERLQLVRLEHMVCALLQAVESTPAKNTVVTAKEIAECSG